MILLMVYAVSHDTCILRGKSECSWVWVLTMNGFGKCQRQITSKLKIRRVKLISAGISFVIGVVNVPGHDDIDNNGTCAQLVREAISSIKCVWMTFPFITHDQI
jgi:hypothetical protein